MRTLEAQSVPKNGIRSTLDARSVARMAHLHGVVTHVGPTTPFFARVLGHFAFLSRVVVFRLFTLRTAITDFGYRPKARPGPRHEPENHKYWPRSPPLHPIGGFPWPGNGRLFRHRRTGAKQFVSMGGNTARVIPVSVHRARACRRRLPTSRLRPLVVLVLSLIHI